MQPAMTAAVRAERSRLPPELLGRPADATLQRLIRYRREGKEAGELRTS